jgi:hypothetical protein
MQTLDRDDVCTELTALQEDVHALVAVATRMPDPSPRVARCRWPDRAAGPAAIRCCRREGAR